MQDRSKVTLAIAGASILAMVLFLVTFTRPSVPHKPKDQRAHPNLERPESNQTDDRSVVVWSLLLPAGSEGPSLINRAVAHIGPSSALCARGALSSANR
jgi:hypothetical protein